MLITNEVVENKEKYLQQYYNDGFKCGNEWLASGRWNFLHPYDTYTYANGQKLQGYIPGGPSFYPYTNYDKAQSIVGDQLHNQWINGWIDGINKYVRDNNLPFDQIPNERL